MNQECSKGQMKQNFGGNTAFNERKEEKVNSIKVHCLISQASKEQRNSETGKVLLHEDVTGSKITILNLHTCVYILVNTDDKYDSLHRKK